MMGNYEQLKAAVAAIIRDNGQEEITGDILQGVLLGIINSVGSGATFAGVATPSTNPGTPDPNVFYIAGQAGTYTNFNLTITDGLWVFENKNGTWVGTSLDVSVLFATGEDVSLTNIASSTAGAGSGDLPTFGVVQEMLNGVIGSVNRSALDTATTAGLYRVMASSAVVGYLFVTVSQSTRYRVQFLSSDITAFTDGGTESDYKGHILTRSYNDSDSTAAVCPLHTWSAWKEYGGDAENVKYGNESVADALDDRFTKAEVNTMLNELFSELAARDSALQAMMDYYVCDTVAGTAAKTITASGYVLTRGGCIRIKMTNTNTADNVTLNINSTGAKALYYDGVQASATNTWEAGEVLEVYYDGTQYQCASGSGGKFKSGENVSDTKIINSLFAGGTTDVLSAEQGKNLADLTLTYRAEPITFTTIGNGYLNDSGDFVSYGSGNPVSDFIPVTAGNAYMVTASSAAFVSSFYCMFGYSSNAEGTMVTPFLSKKQTYINQLVIIPQGVNYVRIGYSGGTPAMSAAIYISKTEVLQTEIDGLSNEVDVVKAYSFYPRELPFTIGLTGYRFLNTGGTYAATGWVITDYISVKAGQKLHITGGGNATNNRVGCWYDVNKTYISVISNVQSLSQWNTTEFTVPNNAAYIRLCGSPYNISIADITCVVPWVENIKDEQYGKILISVENGESNGSGGINHSTDNRWKHTTVNMLAGEKFKLKILNSAGSVNYPFVLYDSTNQTYAAPYIYPGIPEYFTAPYDGTFTMSGTSLNNSAKIDYEVYKLGVGAGSDEYKHIPKTIHTCGHSFWARDGGTYTQFGKTWTIVGYQTIFKQVFTFDGFVNLPYDGHSLGAQSASDTNSIALKLSSWTGGTGDLWTLDTITNDFKRNIPLGTLDDYNAATPSALTYYGALRIFRNKIVELSGTSLIAVVSNATHRNNSGYTSTSTNTAGCTLHDYSNALMCIAEIEGWYFVNVFDYGGIFDDNLAYTTTDGLHPTNLGYKVSVTPWIEQLRIICDKL